MGASTETRLAWVAAAAMGLGLGVQASSIHRLTSRVGLGTPEDALVFGLVFTALVVVGFLAVGRALRLRGDLALGATALAAAALSLADLSVVAAVTSPRGFRTLCRRFGADASLAGTPLVDAAAGLTAFALPALAAGTVLYASLTKRRVLPLTVGAGLGAALSQRLLGTSLAADGSVSLVALGAAATCVGVGVLGLASAPRRLALAAAGVSVLAGALALLLPTTSVPVRIPWQRFPVLPLATLETSDGQWTVDMRRGVHRAVLDQRAVSPTEEELALEGECIARAFDAVFQGERPSTLRVLCFGCVTPERAELLRREGVTDIAATARWWRSMKAVDALLAESGSRKAPASTVVTVVPPGDETRYDLVLVFPRGAYMAAGFDLSLVRRRSEPAVAWLAPDRPLPGCAATQPHLLASDGVERFAVALLFGLEGAGSAGPRRYRRPGWREWMRPRPDDRERRAWALYAAAMAAAPTAGEFERGLARLAELQRASSPFEAPLERVEIGPDALEMLFAHDEPSLGQAGRFQSGVLEGLARVLGAQREVPWTFEYVAPLARRLAPWPALERHLAWAASQELDFDAAARRLEPLASGAQAELASVRAFAEASLAAGRPAIAADALRPWMEADPSDRAVKTQLADALVAADDPEGRRLANELLRDDPSNARLFGLARGIRDMSARGAVSPDTTDSTRR